MARPWARYQIGFMGHAKFLALNGNAIALWWEGKNYCDQHHTDGLIPREAIKMFRFRGAKSIELLMRSCGLKPDGTPYAPLWEAHVVGYKMHDFLEYNDCRDEVLARLEASDDRAEIRKLKDKERQKASRDRRKEELDRLRTSADVTRTSTNSVETSEAEAVSEAEAEKRQEISAAPPRPSRPQPLIARRRLDAAWEGPRGLYVPQKLHRQFADLRNGDVAALWVFYQAVADAYDTGARKTHEIGADMFKFWSARYDEKWPATPVEKPQKDSGPAYQKAQRPTGTEGR